MIRYKKDIDNIVTLTLDMKGRDTNIINHEISRVFEPVIKQLKEERKSRKLKGVIITSAKKVFLEGGELDYLFNADTKKIFASTERLKALYRDLERLGVPVVAAINGAALGAGYELTLACHHRIGINDSKGKIGMPEIKLGFISGGGGLVRLTWLLGTKAFEVLKKGQIFDPQKALKMGMIDDLAENEMELIEKAKTWIINNPKTQQPWDTENRQRAFSDAKNATTAEWIAENTAQLYQYTYNNYPAQQAVLDIIVNSISLDFDTANRVESRYFTSLITNASTQNMTKALWYDWKKIKNGISRPKGFGRFRPKKIGIIGAGTIGSMIAYSCVSVGMKVVLKDVSKPIAERGKNRAEVLLNNAVKKDLLRKEEVERMLDCIKTTKTSKDFEDCDLVIEAVFENANVKKSVTRNAEQHLDEYAFIATATSSLSISKLSKALHHPENFIGLLFHLPADEAKLVEVIRGKKTSDETLARALDFVRKIKRLPVVVNDRRGFLTARIKEMYALEGVSLLLNGVSAPVIEKAGIAAGMRQGPLEMLDTMSIALTLKFMRRKLNVFKKEYYHSEEVDILQKMVEKHHRKGRNSKHGFYDYDGNGGKQLWNGLTELFPMSEEKYDFEEIKNRLLFAQSIEAVRVLETGAIQTVEEANVGSILGWGFPAFKGGVFQYINDFGVQKFVALAKVYEKKYGNRFAAPALLLEKLKKKEAF